MPIFPSEIQAIINQNMELSSDERAQKDCDHRNSLKGNLSGYDCPKCLNRGINYLVRDGEVIGRQCACAEIRADIRRFKNSGLSGLLDSCTFDLFQSPEEWQRSMRRLARQFVTESATSGKWFYAGGQVGSGKTHLCTAIAGELLHSGKSARYMLWRDDVVQLKACVNDDVAYSKLINPLKSATVLYIDDLFKTAAGKRPTDADIHIAFELLNHRYINRQLITILSSEWSVDDLIDIDEAVGSRIYERTKEYCLFIPRDKGRNWRLKK